MRFCKLGHEREQTGGDLEVLRRGLGPILEDLLERTCQGALAGFTLQCCVAGWIAGNEFGRDACRYSVFVCDQAAQGGRNRILTVGICLEKNHEIPILSRKRVAVEFRRMDHNMPRSGGNDDLGRGIFQLLNERSGVGGPVESQKVKRADRHDRLGVGILVSTW